MQSAFQAERVAGERMRAKLAELGCDLVAHQEVTTLHPRPSLETIQA